MAIDCVRTAPTSFQSLLRPGSGASASTRCERSRETCRSVDGTLPEALREQNKHQGTKVERCKNARKDELISCRMY